MSRIVYVRLQRRVGSAHWSLEAAVQDAAQLARYPGAELVDAIADLGSKVALRRGGDTLTVAWAGGVAFTVEEEDGGAAEGTLQEQAKAETERLVRFGEEEQRRIQDELDAQQRPASDAGTRRRRT